MLKLFMTLAMIPKCRIWKVIIGYDLWVIAKKLVVKDHFLCSSLYIITVVNGGLIKSSWNHAQVVTYISSMQQRE